MEKGLSTLEVQELTNKYGRNKLQVYSPISGLSIFFSQFPTVLNGILFIAAILSYLIHDAVDSIFILAILF